MALLLPPRPRRERNHASDFTAALDDYRQYLRRKREAEQRRQQYEQQAAQRTSESNGEGSSGGAAAADMGLKPGETIKLKLSDVRPGCRVLLDTAVLVCMRYLVHGHRNGGYCCRLRLRLCAVAVAACQHLSQHRLCSIGHDHACAALQSIKKRSSGGAGSIAAVASLVVAPGADVGTAAGSFFLKPPPAAGITVRPGQLQSATAAEGDDGAQQAGQQAALQPALTGHNSRLQAAADGDDWGDFVS